MTKEVVILTRDSLRHDYVRKSFGLADDVKVLRSYCEMSSSDLLEEARRKDETTRVEHLERRARSEHDFFAPFVNQTTDHSNPVEIPGGSINNEKYYEEITDLDPDILVAYGCSIIKDPLLGRYKDNFLNVHLGLSPYYRGTGTNFWPLVNNEPEYVGATFMYLDEGVDTGAIIHQIRARVYPGDGPHDIGNRLISDVGQIYPELIRRFEAIEATDQPPEPQEEKYYTSDDYSVEATEQLYTNFEEGLVQEYLDQKDERVKEAPIVKNSAIDEDLLLTEPDI